MPSPQEIKAAVAGVFDRSAESYEQVGVSFFAPIAAGLVERAGLRPGQRVLDVGCGRGHCLFPAVAAVGPTGHVTGVDLAPSMVAATAAEAAARGLVNVTVEEGDAAEPAFAASSFDAILAGLVVFFFPDPAAALRSYVRLLRPGGRFTMSTFGVSDPAFEAAMEAAASFIVGDRPSRKDRYEGPFKTPESIVELVEGNGFTQVSVDEVVPKTSFVDADQWWAWVWSHGGRAVLERVPAERLPAAQAAAYEALDGARAPDGSLTFQSIVRYTTATTPLAHGR